MQAKIWETISVVLLEKSLEIFLHVLILDLRAPHIVLDLLQMIGQILIIFLYFFYLNGQRTE